PALLPSTSCTPSASSPFFLFFHPPAPTPISSLSLHDALPICAFVNCMPVFIAREHYWQGRFEARGLPIIGDDVKSQVGATIVHRSEEHTSELQSHLNLVCRLLLEKKKETTGKKERTSTAKIYM